MKSKAIMSTLAALALALCALPAWSQMGLLAVVQGKVMGADGKPVEGAVVYLTNQDNGQKFSGKTDKKGEFSITGVTVIGAYAIKVMLGDHPIFTTSNYAVEPDYNGISRLNINLAEEIKKSPPKISEEERKRREEMEKENARIRSLNEQFQAAMEAENAGNFDKAITILQSAAQAYPNSDVPWANLAQAFIRAKRYPEAVEPLQKALALKPNEFRYHMALGDVYARSGKSEEAMTEFSTAATLDPQQASTAYFNLGATLTNAAARETDDAKRRKDLTDANAAFDKAIAAKPDYAEAYYQKGLNLLSQASYTKEGKIVPAPGTAEAFQKYLSLEPSGRHAEEAKQLLASLGEQVQTTFKKGK